MRRTRSRSFPVLMLTLAFFAGIVYFLVNLTVHSAEWVSKPYNGHLSDSTGLEFAGMITDRNGIVLARSEDRKRIYNLSENAGFSCVFGG